MNFLKSFSVYSFITVLQAGLSFMMATIFSHLMPVWEFGELNLMLAINAFLLNLVLFSATGTVGLFYHKVNLTKFKLYLSHLIFFLLPITALITFLLYLGLQTRITTVFTIKTEGILLLSLLYVISQSIPLIVFSLHQTREELKKYAIYAFSYYSLTTGSMLLAYTQFHSLRAVFIAFIIVSLLFTLYGVIIMAKNSLLIFRFNHIVMMDILRYNSPLVFYTILMTSLFMSDRFVISHFLGNEQLAMYTVAVNICMGINIFINAFAQSWGIFLFKELKNPHYNRIKLKKIIYLIILLFAILPLIFYILKDFFFFFFDKRYYAAVDYILIVGYMYSFIGIRTIFQGFLHFEKKSHIILISAIAGLVIFYLLIFLFIKNIHIMAITQSMLASLVLMTIFVFYFVNRHYKLWSFRGQNIQ